MKRPNGRATNEKSDKRSRCGHPRLPAPYWLVGVFSLGRCGKWSVSIVSSRPPEKIRRDPLRAHTHTHTLTHSHTHTCAYLLFYRVFTGFLRAGGNVFFRLLASLVGFYWVFTEFQ